MTGQADAEAGRQAAIDEWVRDLVATWPPLSAETLDELRTLFDLSGAGHDTG